MVMQYERMESRVRRAQSVAAIAPRRVEQSSERAICGCSPNVCLGRTKFNDLSEPRMRNYTNACSVSTAAAQGPRLQHPPLLLLQLPEAWQGPIPARLKQPPGGRPQRPPHRPLPPHRTGLLL